MQSTLTKIIIALVVFLAICGAVGWYVVRPQPSTQTGTQTVYTGGTGNTQTTVTTSSQTSTQTGAQTSGVPDITGAYNTLFQQLSAQSIEFTTVTATTTGPAASLYSLYASDIATSKQLYPSETDFSLQIAAVDLNKDGTAEALVYENLPGFCGSGGCSLDIYQDKQGKWVKISSLLAGPDIGLSAKSTGGYSDLFLSVAGTIGSETNVVRYAWAGTQYEPKETMATWNGASFDLVQ